MIADFIRQNHKPSRKWPVKRLQEWVRWFRQDGRCAVVTREGRLVAVALARPLGAEQNETEPYAMDPTSSTVFVDLVVGSWRFFPFLLRMLRLRFPKATHLAFARTRRGLKVRSYSLDHLERKVCCG